MININKKNNFFNSLKIQARVIHALIMREIITRFGRHNLGFAWLFVEPMMFTLGVTALWTFLRSDHGNGMSIIPFAISGYSTVLMWRNAAGRVGNAVEANTGLLFHRNVKVLDVFTARILLEIFGATLSFLGLSLFFIFLGQMELPVNFLLVMQGWFLLAWFAYALGLFIGAIFEISEVVDRLWHAFTYLIFPLSGAGFFVYWFPENFRKLVLYVPMVHFTEMIRHGYYGDLIPTYENVSYILKWNLTLTFLGLYLVRYISKKVEVAG